MVTLFMIIGVFNIVESPKKSSWLAGFGGLGVWRDVFFVFFIWLVCEIWSNGNSSIMLLSSEVRDPLPFSKGCLPAGYKKYSTQNTARMQKGWDRKHV